MWSRKASEKAPSVFLDAGRIYLRPAKISDYAQWVDVRSRNAEFLKPFEPAWPEGCLEPDFFRRRVERLANDWEGDNTYAFLIFMQGTHELLGGININNVTRGAAQMASLGYWIDQPQQGKGLMSDAAGTALDFAFGPLRLARMNAATLVHNDKSQKMLLRLGFEEEGFARSYIQINGRRQDHILYGLNAQQNLSAS